jgi:glycosyltransferase involved in cell wall biosynthesis
MTFEPRNREAAVTVVIIFLNGEKYLGEAIRSVLGQTFIGWELILIDDGSLDRSSDIAQQYAAGWPHKIRYLEHPGHQNRGMSASRNLGIRSGRGEFVAFLDCDDVWHSEKLERQIEILDRYPEAGMVYSATIRWFGWTGRPEDAANDQPRPLGIVPGRLVHPPEMIPRFLRDEGKTPAICSVLIRREAVESVGGFEESFGSLYEDQAFFYKLFLRHVVFVQSGHWDLYRQHPESCCYIASGGRWLTPQHPAFGQFLDWFDHYLSATRIFDRSITIALRRARRPFLQPRRYRVERALAARWGSAQALARRLARKILPGACS